MELLYNNKKYEIVIEKKIGQKNTYIRVKNDCKVSVTTSYFTSNKYIENLIKNNYSKIGKMINQQESKKKNNTGFFYLGKKYEVIEKEEKEPVFKDNIVYIPKNFDIDKWYKSQAKELFLNRLDILYNEYTRKIPYPKLRIRKMKTRWGVCNIQTHIITLNLELMKREPIYLDYVIIHEMTHLVYGDHSKKFWNLVEENMPNYKKYRDEMKDF